MSNQLKSGDINISTIPVDGIGGLGLVAGAAIVAFLFPPLRWLAFAGLVGGAGLGLFLIGSRDRRARRGAEIGGVMLLSALAIGAFIYLRG